MVRPSFSACASVARAYSHGRKVEHAVAWKATSTRRNRPGWGLVIALSILFGLFAPVAQAMLLTLDFYWENAGELEEADLQVGSIIQIIAYKYGEGTNFSSTVGSQFETYGTGPGGEDVYLADTTQQGHSIIYTGTITEHGSAPSTWYGLYTQITVDDWEYDRVYVRVFGATNFPLGQAVLSSWGISETPTTIDPVFQTQTFGATNMPTSHTNYFEVIPEPATLGLLGLGGCALAAWRRRRSARQEERP